MNGNPRPQKKAQTKPPKTATRPSLREQILADFATLRVPVTADQFDAALSDAEKCARSHLEFLHRLITDQAGLRRRLHDDTGLLRLDQVIVRETVEAAEVFRLVLGVHGEIIAKNIAIGLDRTSHLLCDRESEANSFPLASEGRADT